MHHSLVYLCIYLYIELKKKTAVYDEKLSTNHPHEKTMVGICWDIKELESIVETSRKLYVDLQTVGDELAKSSANPGQNIAKKLTGIKGTTISLVKNISRHKRTAATHALVIMISPEERNHKPYAIPVQCLPYSSLTDKNVRHLMNLVIKEMVQRGMKVAGKFSLHY